MYAYISMKEYQQHYFVLAANALGAKQGDYVTQLP